jgi:hypothetical protein
MLPQFSSVFTKVILVAPQGIPLKVIPAINSFNVFPFAKLYWYILVPSE